MLHKISFVGIDDSSDFSELISMEAEAHGFYNIEIGVLYSINNSGIKPRYPSYDFINSFPKFFKNSGVGTSIHLCGSQIIKEFLSKKIEKQFIKQFNRVQVNINVASFMEDNIVTLEELYSSLTGLPYYIDMESGIRTDDKFDISKCKQIINSLIDYDVGYVG